MFDETGAAAEGYTGELAEARSHAEGALHALKRRTVGRPIYRTGGNG
jgi:hypothetical protein